MSRMDHLYGDRFPKCCELLVPLTFGLLVLLLFFFWGCLCWSDWRGYIYKFGSDSRVTI